MKPEKSQHTPGPWIVEEKAEMVFSGNVRIAADIGAQNVSLILAAPDLLAAAKEAKEELNKLGGDYDVLRKLRAAIEKAEGGK